MRKAVIFFLISIVFSCQKNENNTIEDINLVHFEQLFYENNIPLDSLKEKYALFFDKITADSIWNKKRNDSLEIEIYQSIKDSFLSVYDFDSELGKLFGRIKTIDTSFALPNVYTFYSNFDYLNQIIYDEENLFIASDMFLGENSKYYGNLPKYIRKNMTKENLVSKVAFQVSNSKISDATQTKYLLDHFIYEGKKILLASIFLGGKDKNIGEAMLYTPEQLAWVNQYEFKIWQFFIQNEYLYDSNPKLVRRFVDLAPFTKFYTALDQDSPGRVGVWVGVKILKAWMEETGKSIEEMLKQNDSQKILQESKYKPKY